MQRLFVDTTKFKLGNSLFGTVKLTKNADPDKCRYSGYGIGFATRGSFSFSDSSGSGSNGIIFGADMNSSAHVDNKKKNILILDKGPTQGLDDNTLTAEKEYTERHKKFCLSLHYNGVNSYLFVNGVAICKFKAKDSEINSYPIGLGNISKDFLTDSMENTGLYGYICDFSVHYESINIGNISDIHKYLMKKT